MSNSQVFEITDANFFETVNDGLALVDFWAPWCAPCLMQGPIIEKVAGQFSGQAKIGKMNIDSNQSIASKFGVRSIPTLILFKDGRELRRFVGVQMEGTLVRIISENLGVLAKDTFVKV